MLYLGSNFDPPKILPTEWDKINLKRDDWILKVQSLCVEELEESEDLVKNKFKEKFVVYVGSYEGCGCGFSHCLKDDDLDLDDNPLEVEASFKSRKALYEYVKQNKISTLYGCWNGDESLAAEGEIKISIEKLIDKEFEYPKKIIVKLI